MVLPCFLVYDLLMRRKTTTNPQINIFHINIEEPRITPNSYVILFRFGTFLNIVIVGN